MYKADTTMAKKNNNELTVGITAAIVLALAVYIIVLLADFTRLTTDYQELTFRLPYTCGLRGLSSGSPVHLGGYKVGQVTSTQIDDAGSDPDNIYVLFSIELPEKYKLHDNCILTPEMGLLGGKAILNIASLGNSETTLSENSIYNITFGDNMVTAIKKELDPTNPTGVLAAVKAELDRNNENSLLGALANSARNLDDITSSVKTELDTGSPAALLTKVHNITGKLDNSLTGIQNIITDNKSDLRDTIISLKHSAGILEKELPLITAKFEQVIDKAACGLDTAQDALHELKITGELASDTMANNRDKIDALIDNMTEVSTNLKLVSREVRRAPWRLLYKPQQKEMEIQATIDTAAAFAAGAERLDNAANSLKKAIGQLGQNAGENRDKIKNLLADLENSFDQFHKAEKKLWQDMDQ